MIGNESEFCYLDQIRLRQGNEKLLVYFNNLITFNIEKAIKLINHENLYFITLYLLRDIILNSELQQNINSRNKVALEIVDEIENRRKSSKEKRIHLSEKKPKSLLSYFVMKWMFETGWQDDGLSDNYDDILDTVAIFLIKIYHDMSILPILATLLFRRNRKGSFYHDLLWALYESKSPFVLQLLAQGLISDNFDDFKLAKRLLSFIPSIEKCNSRKRAYKYFLNWFTKNKNFLQYTGESFQLTSRPIPFSPQSKFEKNRVGDLDD